MCSCGLRGGAEAFFTGSFDEYMGGASTGTEEGVRGCGFRNFIFCTSSDHILAIGHMQRHTIRERLSWIGRGGGGGGGRAKVGTRARRGGGGVGVLVAKSLLLDGGIPSVLRKKGLLIHCECM